MEKINAGLWGRIGDLDIEYEGGHATAHQLNTVKMLVKFWRIVNNAAPDAAAYCRERFADKVGEATDDEIVAMLEPKALFVGADEEKRNIALMCTTELDPAGVALKYRNEALIGVMTCDEARK